MKAQNVNNVDHVNNIELNVNKINNEDAKNNYSFTLNKFGAV